jgi:glutamate/tyrosine decarboxylase-like PLP-dependent enzyme
LAKPQKPEQDLDPGDWEAFRALGHQMIDDVVDHMRDVRDRPIWQAPTDAVKALTAEPYPRQGKGESAAYDEFKTHIFEYGMGNTHPRFWGWVMGNGIPFAVLAEMLAATINPNMGGGDHVANYVERQVINWCKQMMDFPPDASGLLVSGGSMANFVGLTVARNTKAGFNPRKAGLKSHDRQLVFYASSETHSSNYKAVEMLGIGKDNMRFIPVNAAYQIDLNALETAIQADKAAGLKPVCVVGNAGTVGTGAVDDLNALADICEREDLWLHVDGAFGALAYLPEATRARVDGLQRADSISFDLHKWMYFPFEVACVLIRRESDHLNSFIVNPDYLAHMPRGVAGGHHVWYGDMGLQLTRSFRALKVWMTVKAYGMDRFAQQIEQNIDQAGYLESLVEAQPELELLAPVPLNIVCYRFKAPGMDDETLNEFNRELMMRLHERSIAIPTYTMLNGKFALRAAIVNHRSTRADFDLLVEKTVTLGEELLAEYDPPA